MSKSTRKGLLLMTAIMAGIMTMTSAAYACVVFRGRMTVTGNLGTTTVEGEGYSHGYCSPGGRPLTAAGGTAGSEVAIETGPGIVCETYTDTSTNTTEPNVLPPGTYLVKFNQGEGQVGSTTNPPTVKPAYTYEAPFWTMKPQMGCFPAKNSGTTTDLGTIQIGSDGKVVGNNKVSLAPLYNSTAASKPGEAYNFCIGEETPSATTTLFGGRVGLLAPFQLVGI